MVGEDSDLLDKLFDQSLIKLCNVGFLPGDKVLQQELVYRPVGTVLISGGGL